MKNYSYGAILNNTINNYGITFIRRATWRELMEYKPHFFKIIKITGKDGKPIDQHVRKNVKHISHCRYWLTECVHCNATGIIRQDQFDKVYCRKCRTQVSKRKPYTPSGKPRMPRKRKTGKKFCPMCRKYWPRNIKFWYISKKTGQCQSYCRFCCRVLNRVSDKQLRNDCGRLIH